MAVILDDDVGVLVFDSFGQFAKHGRLSDTGHVFQTDFLSTSFYQFIGYLAIILHRVYGRGGDTQRGLRGHAGLKRPFDAGDDIAGVVKTTENTWNVHTLSVLHMILQLAHVIGHRIHTQGIQTTVQHVGLDAYFVEGLAECTYSGIGVLTGQQIDLLESTTVGLYACETAHVDNRRGYALQLVFTGLKLTRGLPHVSINKTELNFLFHCNQFKLLNKAIL